MEYDQKNSEQNINTYQPKTMLQKISKLTNPIKFIFFFCIKMLNIEKQPVHYMKISQKVESNDI